MNNKQYEEVANMILNSKNWFTVKEISDKLNINYYLLKSHFSFLIEQGILTCQGSNYRVR